MRWSAKLQRIEQESEFLLCLVRSDIQGTEHLRLDFLSMNAHRAAADFPAVEDHVIGFCQSFAWLAVEEALMPIHRTGERMMQGIPTFFLFVPIKHGKVDHPQRTPGVCRMALLVSDLRTQCAERIVHHFGLVRAKEDQIAILGTGTLQDGLECLI